MLGLNTTQVGDALEIKVYEHFLAEINAGRFISKESCRIFWKKKYFSKDRNDYITFDVAIEFYLPDANEYTSVFLIECKNYSSPVPVGDIESFFSKVQQVAPAGSKAIMVSNACFQSGTLAFAKSKKIGLMRYFTPGNCKWELMRSPSSGARTTSVEDAQYVEKALSEENFKSDVFDLFMQSSTRATFSVWEFFADLLQESALSADQIEMLLNNSSQPASCVSFIKPKDFEFRTAEILSEIEYDQGEVNLERICQLEFQRNGLIVSTDVMPDSATIGAAILGRIEFYPPKIQVYKQQGIPNRGRDRFTLAHELAHYFLDHGKYLIKESCDDRDFDESNLAVLDKSDVARLEFQANFLAASLLMPKRYVEEDFFKKIRTLDTRGFRYLYLDHQQCNLQNFSLVADFLTRKYGVSRAAVRIRLKSIGLLKDARTKVGIADIAKSIYPLAREN